MSIKDFHAQLTQSDQPDAMLATLRRLCATGDAGLLERLDQTEDGPVWGIWTGLSSPDRAHQ
jgi:hypothetical protein